MKRTKAWWSKYTQNESWFIWDYERQSKKYGHGGSSYLPDDCSECIVCGDPMFGGGNTCTHCDNKYNALMERNRNGS